MSGDSPNAAVWAFLITSEMPSSSGRYRIPIDPDDAAQACVLLACRKLEKMNPEKGCFSYLTTCCFNELRKMMGGDARWQRLIDQAAARMRPDRRHVQRKSKRRDAESKDSIFGAGD